MTIGEFFSALARWIEGWFDRVGLAWTRTFEQLAQGNIADIVISDIFLVVFTATAGGWFVLVAIQDAIKKSDQEPKESGPTIRQMLRGPLKERLSIYAVIVLWVLLGILLTWAFSR